MQRVRSKQDLELKEIKKKRNNLREKDLYSKVIDEENMSNSYNSSDFEEGHKNKNK